MNAANVLPVLFAIVLLASSGCEGRSQAPPKNDPPNEQQDDEASDQPATISVESFIESQRDFRPSFAAVLANPAHFHGKKIQLKGFLHIEFEGNAIYLSKDDADHLITRNGFWVSFDKQAVPFEGNGPKEFHRKWVLIEGVFDKDGGGHMNSWYGEIKNIDRIYELKRYYKD